LLARPLNGDAKQVRLPLHEKIVRCRATVHAQVG
jgi:hypothetical protein